MSQQTASGKEKLASIGCRLSTLGHWGCLLPTPKYPAGALRGATRPAPRAIYCLASTSPPAEFTKHLPQLQAMGYLPSASSRRLRSKQSGHELMRPCPQRDVRYVSPASPTCVSVLWVTWLGMPEPHGMNSSPYNTCGYCMFKTQLG